MKTLVLAAIRCSLLFTAVAALSIAHPAKANLITNPGFETGDFTGWNQESFAVDNSNPHSGLYAAVSNSSDGFIYQTIHTVPGARYNLSLWVAGLGHFSIVWNGSGIEEIFLRRSPYFQLTYTDLVATGSATRIDFFYNMGVEEPLVYLDDVSVTRSGVGVGEPFSTLWFALPVAGMIAFGLFRPKRVLAL